MAILSQFGSKSLKKKKTKVKIFNVLKVKIESKPGQLRFNSRLKSRLQCSWNSLQKSF